MAWDVAPSQDIVTQPWGCTDYPGEWYAPWCAGGHYHAGIDLGYSGGGSVTCGRPVYATRSGLVVAVGANGQGNAGFSQYLGPNAVCIKYDDGMYVEHGHLSAAHVVVGQRVSPGTHIGDIGTLGASSACHLHVEARVDGPYQGVANNAANIRDPSPYLHLEDTMTPEEHAWLATVVTTLTMSSATPNNPATWTIRDLLVHAYNGVARLEGQSGGTQPSSGGGLTLSEIADALDAASAKLRSTNP